MNKHLIFLIVLFLLLIIQKDTEKDNKMDSSKNNDGLEKTK